ncbi:MAG: hypothetical protein M1829_004395 [Trizodia sp. TS-e1964]|nr:MAG: hypothetical protein M1829_004395 [Trizodia sp. TS-e1964]
MASPYYPVPPPGYAPYGYTTPLSSPSPAGPNGYYSPYSPRYNMPSPRGPTTHSHSRRASQDTYEFSSPPRAAYPIPRPYSTMPGYSSPQRTSEFVSHSRVRSKQRRFVRPSGGHSRAPRFRHHYDEDEDDYIYAYPFRAAHHRYHGYSGADQYHYYDEQAAPFDRYEPDGVPASRLDTDYDRDESTAPRRSRARRASHSTGQSRQSTRTVPPPKTPKPAPPPTAAPPPPKATEEDARRANIPRGFSIKNWDPTEEPIILLGSVFDANSLGKWIYDWTVFYHGPATPIAEIAGELWLMLIQLAGKVKRAEECIPRIRTVENKEMVEDFIEGGERLWDRLKRLLKACEEPMLKSSSKSSKSSTQQAQLGKNAGCEFVDSIFGRDRQLEKTEKLMAGMELWSKRFDANCEDILRRPSA